MVKKITPENQVTIKKNHRDLADAPEPTERKPVPLAPKPEAPEYLLQFFAYDHLPAHMQGTSQLFHDLAHALIAVAPKNPERTMALRRLLEAKDCAVRAQIFKV